MLWYFCAMEFEVRNVARVREARIRLDGVTVLVGPNGSGKSTIARGLMTLRSLVQALPQRLLQEKARSLIVAFAKHLRDQESSRTENAPWATVVLFSVQSLLRIQNPDKVCAPAFWGDVDGVYNYFFESGFGGENMRYFLESIPGEENAKALFRDVYGGIGPKMVESAQEQKDEAYTQFIIERAFQNSYVKQINTQCGNQGNAQFGLREDACSATVSFEEEACVSRDITGRVLSETHYLEPRHVLDDLTQGQRRRDSMTPRERPSSRYVEPYEASWMEFLRVPRVKDPTLEEAQEEAKRMEMLDRISDTIHGRLAKSSSGIIFQDSAVKGEIRIPNIASGMKSMALIARAIENGWIVQGDLLIIDEPESNLHPEWQVRFAEWLVLLAKHLQIRVLLNTHSPYFMRSIERSCAHENLREALHVYSMEADRDEEGEPLPTFSAKDVSNDIAHVYSVMARPFDELD